MGEVLPLPHRGETFLDPRGEGRSIRVSGHRGAATVVLSIWQHGECRATFRLAGSEVDGFVRALLAAAPPAAPAGGSTAEKLRSVVTEVALAADATPVTTVATVIPAPRSTVAPTEPVAIAFPEFLEPAVAEPAAPANASAATAPSDRSSTHPAEAAGADRPAAGDDGRAGGSAAGPEIEAVG